jgi:Ca2+-binding EF-hand superfamily protein
MDVMSSKCGRMAEVDRILRDIDTDRDGRINYEEFCNHMRIRVSENE